MDRGEVQPVEHADLLADLVIGPMMCRFFLAPVPGGEIEAATPDEMAAQLLPFLLRAVGYDPR